MALNPVVSWLTPSCVAASTARPTSWALALEDSARLLPQSTTWWGLLLYSLLLLALVGTFARVRGLRLEREQHQLERTVATRTQALEDHSRELRLVNLRLEKEMKASQEAEQARRALESRIHANQRLESLGVLAGGIAHDFNNLLVGIMGSAELALRELSPGSPLERNLRDILVASERAADLCRQMLAYAGKAPFLTTHLDLTDAVRGINGLLATSVADNVRIETRLTDELPTVGADRSQVEQLIVNLVINAAEAIGESPGTITIETGERDCDAKFLAAHPQPYEISEGRYAFLEISDTGQGIEPELLEKIFEPFFTTKFLGRGLGLAAVYGILRRHHGIITVESELGRGTTLRAYFPVLEEAVPAAAVAAPERQLSLIEPAGYGTVLIVDDEEMVRNLARKVLERDGFSAVVAEDGSAGVSALRSLGSQVSCVLLDMTMPKMDGESALREMRRIAPHLPIIIMSGHSEKQISERFSTAEVADFLYKPFAIDQLQGKVRKAIALAHQPSTAASEVV